MSDPEQQGEVQECQQEAPSDTKAAPSARGHHRQAPLLLTAWRDLDTVGR